MPPQSIGISERTDVKSTSAHPETTSVGALFQETADKHPGLSGFSVVERGRTLFLARLAMADLAEKTLDAQYYIWDSDTTSAGSWPAGCCAPPTAAYACDYILIDDQYQTEARDSAVAALDGHPNIEIRFFPTP